MPRFGMSELSVCIWALAANCTESPPAGFMETAKIPKDGPPPLKPEQTTYMDAILHNVHFPCKPADPHIPMAEDLRDRTLKNVRCYAQDALRDIWHCRSTSWWKGTKRRRSRSQFTLCSVKFGVIWRYGMYGISQICANMLEFSTLWEGWYYISWVISHVCS